MKKFTNPTGLVMLGAMIYMLIMNRSGMPFDVWLLHKALMLPGIIMAISFHEFAHGIVAYKLGDMTPKFQGRLTVNPLAHIDPIGFVALLAVGFGWGKPVEINPRSFKNPRRDELLVSLAGVIMNLILAAIFAVVYRVFFAPEVLVTASEMVIYLSYIVYNIIYINVVLMIFNLLPVPPLDGFGIVTELFDLKRKDWYWSVYNNGFFILLILILFDVTDRVILPILSAIMGVLVG